MAPDGATLTISANPTAIPLVGGASTITVIGFKSASDGGGTLPDGTQIFFSTTVGVIDERAAMENGIARAQLRSNGRAGTATVTASSGNGISAIVDGGVVIGNAEGINIVLTANPVTLVPPDFTTELVATVFDNANNPLPDVPMIFTTTAGALASHGSVLRTNPNGQASDRLTLREESSASVTVFSGTISSNSVTVSRGTILNPVVSSVSPAAGAPGRRLTVTINGLNFQAGATAGFGDGIAVEDVSFVAPTALRATINISSAAAEGSRTVTVTNPDGGAGSLSNGFLVSASAGGGGGGGGSVAVTSVSPTSANQGQTLSATITGVGFQAGAVASFGAGIVVNSTTFVSASQLQANITVSSSAAAGARNVTVVNPDSTSGSLSGAFTVVVPPVISSVTPTNGNPGDVIPGVLVQGANFQSGATVDFGPDITITMVFFVDSADLFVDVTISPTATSGPVTVTVTNPDAGTGSLTNGFTIN